MKKIEILGQALSITDTVNSNIDLSEPKGRVWYNEDSLKNGIITFYDIDSTEKVSTNLISLNLSDAVDSSLVAFTESTFRTFAQNNLGFNSALGSSRAVAQVHLDAPQTTSIATINTETDVNLTGATLTNLKDFTFDNVRTFTYNGATKDILFLGDANEEVLTTITGTVNVTMVLKYNGVVVIESPVSFGKKNEISTFSANRTFISTKSGDTFTLQIKSDTLVDVSLSKLHVQFIEI